MSRFKSEKPSVRTGAITTALVLLTALWGITGCSELGPVDPTTPDVAADQGPGGPEPVLRAPRDPASLPAVTIEETSAGTPGDKAGRVITMYCTEAFRGSGMDWQNVDGAEGAPGANDNQDATKFAYDDVMSSSQKLIAWWFNYPTLQAGERITGVYVDVQARYDAGTSANTVRLYAAIPTGSGGYREIAKDATWQQYSNDDVFLWRMGGTYGWNITGQRAAWTMDDIIAMYMQVRRFPNNDPINTSRARINAFRIVITTAS